jgi:hypothetical protein
MTSPRHDGPVKSHLERLVTRHSHEDGVTADRVRRNGKAARSSPIAARG